VGNGVETGWGRNCGEKWMKPGDVTFIQKVGGKTFLPRLYLPVDQGVYRRIWNGRGNHETVAYVLVRKMADDWLKFVPFQNARFLLSTNLAWKLSEIVIDLLLIVISTADELSGSTNTDDLERPVDPDIHKMVFLMIFHRDFRLRRIFQRWIAPKLVHIDQEWTACVWNF